MIFDLHEIGVENDLVTVAVEVVVLSRNVVDVNVAELGLNGHIAINNGLASDLSVGSLNDPLFKDLTGNERILRHGANCLASGTVVLGHKLGRGITVRDDESNIVVILELCLDGKVGGDGHACSNINRFAINSGHPLDEGLALNHRVLGKRKGITGIVGVGLVGLATVHERDSEGVLVILGPHLGISSDGHVVAEVAATVDPLARVTGLGGNGRNIIQAIVGVDSDSLGGDLGSLVLLIEGHRVADLVVVRNDGSVSFGNPRRADSGTGYLSLFTLSTLDNLANGPVGVPVLASDSRRKLIANGFALRDLYGVIHFGITVIERDGPSFSVFFASTRFDVRLLFLHHSLSLGLLSLYDDVGREGSRVEDNPVTRGLNDLD